MKTCMILMACLALSVPVAAADFETGLQIGHVAGIGGEVQFGVTDFARNLPASATEA